MADERLITDLEAGAERHAVHTRGGRVVMWRRFGEGAPLVLLHGGHGRWLHWARNIPALSQRYAVWVPDLPGYGESDVPAEPTLAALVSATHETLDALIGPAAPIRLAGFSFGGLVAAHLAAARDGVTHLALLGPAGNGGPRRPRGALRNWKEFPAGSAAREDVMRHNLLVHMLHDPKSLDPEALRIHTDACERTRFHSKKISRSGGLRAALDSYARPLLLVCGEHDVTLTPEMVEPDLTGGRGQARAVRIPDAGHWVQYEAAGQVDALLLSWFGEGPSQSVS